MSDVLRFEHIAYTYVLCRIPAIILENQLPTIEVQVHPALNFAFNTDYCETNKEISKMHVNCGSPYRMGQLNAFSYN